MADIVIYTKTHCSYCVRAKQLLNIKGVEFKEINVDDDMAKFDVMVSKAGGKRTVPQIFINDQHIGGCDDMMALNDAGELDALLR